MSPTNKGCSPKTPGGISKSLLTPCRRVGLSRKWRKSGCSPFISPLSTPNSTPENKEDVETKKRKKRSETLQNETPKEQLHISELNVSVSNSYNDSHENNNITTTPSRTQIPRKISKSLSLSLNSEENTGNEILSSKIAKESHITENNVQKENTAAVADSREIKNKHITEWMVSKPTKHKSEGIITKLVRTKSTGKPKLSLKNSNSKTISSDEQPSKTCENTKPKETSPNNLTKECIVVIQNKIFKADNVKTKVNTESDAKCDIPPNILKRNSTDLDNVTLNTIDTDFIKKSKEMKTQKIKRNLSIIRPPKNVQIDTESSGSQSSQEDGTKRTILVKKTYDKVTVPLKAKSTGSITQKDIDDLKERIEMKKKLLMAKAMSKDTEELRYLIKKWQKGCQDALMELLELMKKKLPDQKNMDYAEILQTLKIPPELVGYDSENDCFVTPDDINILMSTFKL